MQVETVNAVIVLVTVLVVSVQVFRQKMLIELRGKQEMSSIV